VIRSIELEDFRNYERKKIGFEPGINVIIGKNGRGKTNLLEAVFLLLQGRSMRTSSTKDAVREGCERAVVSGTFHVQGEIKTRIVIDADGTTEGRKNVRNLRAVSFQPDDIWMVKGGPEARRRCLDEAIVDIKKGYRETLLEYQRILRQRNEAIKAVRRGAKGREYIRNWNDLLLERGSAIVEERIRAAGTIEGLMAEVGRRWNKGELELKYYASLTRDVGESGKAMEKIKKMEEAEIRRGATLVGPHRDEIVFLLDGRNVRRECSQGEQKLVVLMWRLAQARAMEAVAGKKTLLLLDDCLSELDENNRLLLLEEIGSWEQAMVTTTDDSREFDGTKRVWLEKEAVAG
jgi:DNA replication and repair protein RecF